MNSDQTTLTAEERRKIQGRSTDYYNETIHDPMTHKILLCLLETVKELKDEVKTLRSSNQAMEGILKGLLGRTVYTGDPAIRTCT